MYCIISFAMVANATDKKEVVVKTADEKETVTVTNDSDKIMVNNFKKVETENNKCTRESSEDDDSNCGEKGNLEYSLAREAGLDHREARKARRAYVRECRGGTWAWIGVCVGFIGHCD